MLKDILDVRPFWRSFVGKNFPVVFDNGHFDAVSKKIWALKVQFFLRTIILHAKPYCNTWQLFRELFSINCTVLIIPRLNSRFEIGSRVFLKKRDFAAEDVSTFNRSFNQTPF